MLVVEMTIEQGDECTVRRGGLAKDGGAPLSNLIPNLSCKYKQILAVTVEAGGLLRENHRKKLNFSSGG